MGDSAAPLRVDDVKAAHQNAIVALHNVDLTVQHGEVYVLLGTNGVDKSSTLKAISNLLVPERGQVTTGTIVFDGRDVAHTIPAQLVRPRLVQVLEGRHHFPNLSVESNLVTGTLDHNASRAETAVDPERVYAIFPRLKVRRRVAVGLTSGGEWQMAAIGRALMSCPHLLVSGELSMGLVPLAVQDVFARLRQLSRKDGLLILAAEQSFMMAPQYANRATMLETGVTVLNNTAGTLGQHEGIQHFCFDYDVVYQAPASMRAVRSSFPVVHDNRGDNPS